MPDAETELDLAFHPPTPERWADLETVFGPRGACDGCWCMFWRLPRPRYDASKDDVNREALHGIVDSGRVPGILAYAGGEPVGWCAVEPRGGARASAPSAWTGFAAAFRHAGFTEVARRAETRPIMRLAIDGGGAAGAEPARRKAKRG